MLSRHISEVQVHQKINKCLGVKITQEEFKMDSEKKKCCYYFHDHPHHPEKKKAKLV